MLDALFMRRRRRELRMSQRQLATQMGVNVAVVSRLEEGENHHVLTLAMVEDFATALSVEPLFLLSASRPSPSRDPESLLERRASCFHT